LNDRTFTTTKAPLVASSTIGSGWEVGWLADLCCFFSSLQL